MDETQNRTGQAEEWGGRLLEAFDAGTALEPLTTGAGDGSGSNDLAALATSGAYEIAAAIRCLREARGETVIGWKIGFTNRTIWDEYDVHAPIWGPMYDTTSVEIAGSAGPHDVRISHLHEPRIEPEIAIRFARAPQAGMTEAELLECIDAVCHAFEIVQCPFPGWVFRPVDTMAAAALHGAFVHGPWVEIELGDRVNWLSALADFTLTLRGCGPKSIEDRGHAGSVLDGPLSALRWFVDGLAADLHGRFIEAGDVVTTGTVTRAFPIAPGQTWSTELAGLSLPGLFIRCV